MSAQHKDAKALLLLFLLGFGLVITRNAWLSDDAYITFRTVDNFVNGYGLTWNPPERVQAYTHPLWMFLLSSLYLFTREIYFSSLFLSIALSLAAVAILALGIARSTFAAMLGVTILTLSKAFVDYSTSGLENPLTHLTLVLFLLTYLKSEPGTRKLFYLALLTGLGMVNRLDTALLFLPPLGYALFETGVDLKDKIRPLMLGLAPFVLWELFSLFYYGFPFPNTAYAKLNVGLISQSQLYEQGLYYFLNSIRLDPVTLLVILWGILTPLVLKRSRLIPLTVGLSLYLLYVLRIGGDFMSGRFFAAPLLVAVVLLLRVRFARSTAPQLAFLVLIVGIGLSSPHSPVSSEFNQSAGTDNSGITDEKGNYWPSTGLMRAGRYTTSPDHDWAREGQAAREQNPGVVEKGSVGFFGFFAGPQIHVVDLLGLADPLLARLPPADPNWATGHYGRRAPQGYIETLAGGENRIRNPDLATFYDKLNRVTRGDLFDPGRLGEIWKFNTGAYDHYRKAYSTFEGETLVQRLRLTNPTDHPYAYAFVWNDEGAEAFLLDDASQPGSVYTVTWHIAVDEIGFEGRYQKKISSGGPLDDDSTLNVGAIFSPTPDLTAYSIYEHRYWFRIAGDRLILLLQGMGWHNDQAPEGVWQETDVNGVIERSWPRPDDVSR